MVAGYYPSKDELIEITNRAPYKINVRPVVAFDLKDQATAEERFKTRRALLYARFGNPVSHHVEDIVSQMDGAGQSLSMTSGTTANFLAMFTLAGWSQQLASSNHIFGGTYGGQQGILANGHIKTHYFDPRRPDQLHKLLKKNKKIGAVFLETISNADNIIPDIEKMVDVAHNHNKPIIFDNTYAFGQFQPFKWGADFATVSLTKGASGGENDVLGGVVQSRGDSGSSAWLQKYQHLYPFITGYQEKSPNDPDPAFGLMYGYCGSGIGTPLQVQSAMTISQGLGTLLDRTDIYNSNAKQIATQLDDPKYKASGLIKHVNHLSLDHPDHDKVEKYMPGHYGSVMLVDFKSKDAAAAFINNSGFVGVHIIQNPLMVTHLYTTTHRQYSDEMKAVLGITPGMVRVTVGNEPIDQAQEKVERGLHYAAKVA